MNKTTGNPGKQKLVRDISANTLQTLITQVFGFVIFYITSKYLSKDEFGEFNWATAVGSTIIATASLGLDLVFVKRVASGENVMLISGIHFFHTVVVGIVVCMVAFVIKLFMPVFNGLHPVIFLIFINLALANIANSFKLCLNGLESYRQLALMALFANVIKVLMILFLFVLHRFTVFNVVLAYMFTSLAEFLIGYYLVNRNITSVVKPILNFGEYKYFILESLPQLGVVVFDSALARIDWILLGIISTSVATAEYSFVYKIFEYSKFPLMIVAPVLLTRFSKMFVDPASIDDRNRSEINMFFRLEMFVITLIPIILITLWTPLMDFLTDNKYGGVNEINYWILAPCVPLVCIVNFLWTLGFVQGQLKVIMFITIGVSSLNILCNAMLIPIYGQMGASISYLASTVMQLVLYLLFVRQVEMKLDYGKLVVAMLNMVIAVAIAKLSGTHFVISCIIAVAVHIALAFATRQVNFRQLREVIGKKQTTLR